VVVHRADCILLDGDFYDEGERETATTLEAAQARMRELELLYDCRSRLCSWCKPCGTH
jgi:hypothetical protein